MKGEETIDGFERSAEPVVTLSVRLLEQMCRKLAFPFADRSEATQVRRDKVMDQAVLQSV